MDSEKLYQAIGLVSDEKIEAVGRLLDANPAPDSEVITAKQDKRMRLSRQFMPMIAAMLVLAVGVGAMLYFLAPNKPEAPNNGVTGEVPEHDSALRSLIGNPPYEFFQPVTREQAQEYLSSVGIFSWQVIGEDELDISFIKEDKIQSLFESRFDANTVSQTLEEPFKAYIFDICVFHDYDWDNDVYIDKRQVAAVSKEHGLIFTAVCDPSDCTPESFNADKYDWLFAGAIMPDYGKPVSTTEADLEIFDVTPTGLTYMFRNPTDKTFEFGDYYWVWERSANGGWTALKPVIDNAAFTAIARTIPANMQTVPQYIDWKWLYGELPQGEYLFAHSLSSSQDPTDYKWSRTFTIEETTTDPYDHSEPFEWTLDSDFDENTYVYSGRETLELPEFPDVLFEWNYPHHSGERFAPNQNNITAFFADGEVRRFPVTRTSVIVADINKDGFPDFVFNYDFTSGLPSSGVAVYDFKNDELHFLDGYGDWNFANITNGNVMVSHSEKRNAANVYGGELTFKNGELVIGEMDKKDDNQIPRWSWDWCAFCGDCINCVYTPDFTVYLCSVCDNPLSSSVCEKHRLYVKDGDRLCGEWYAVQNEATGLYTIENAVGDRFIDVEFMEITRGVDKLGNTSYYTGIRSVKTTLEKVGLYMYNFRVRDRDGEKRLVFDSVTIEKCFYGQEEESEVYMKNNPRVIPEATEQRFIDISELEDASVIPDIATDLILSLTDNYDETVLKNNIEMNEITEKFWKNRSDPLAKIEYFYVSYQHYGCPESCEASESANTLHVQIAALFGTPVNGYSTNGYWEFGFSFKRVGNGFEPSHAWVDLIDSPQYNYIMGHHYQ
ncbi:MAG: hypothetical protein FWF82_01330 [Oscillospiraceae bacterium]|nr:hypothetical protein [Oscillospiraceae bacterium]